MSFYSEIETERLYLRMPKVSDIKPYFNYQKKQDNYPYADLYPVKTIEEMEKIFLDILNKMNLHDTLFWILEDKNTQKPVGSLSAWNIDVNKNSIEFGYNVFPYARRKGYMAEAIKGAIYYLYDGLGFTLFDIWTNKDNVPSINLANKLGFAFKGYVDEKAHHSDKIITYATFQLKIMEEDEKNNG